MNVNKINKQIKVASKFTRKNQDCTSFYFVLCGERLLKVQARKEQHKIDTGKDLSWEAATNLVILGK